MAGTRIALVGLGMAVVPHARSLKDLAARVEVTAAYSPTAARRDAFSEAWGFPVTDDLEGVFTDPSIDAVMILTPPSSHLELVRRAAGAGKHVLLEKPLETSIAKAEELVGVAEAAGMKLGVVLQHRFKPASVRLASLLAEGRLGTIVSASARTQNWRPQSYYDQPGRGTLERDGGGVLLTQAIHTLDLFISLAGLPDEVTAYATTSPIHRMETEDLAMAAIRFANGAIGAISATTCAHPGFPDAIDIIGTMGTAQLDDAGLSVHLHDGTSSSERVADAAGGAGADPMAFSHHHHRGVIEDFLDAVEGDGQPRITGREALKVHRLIDAMLRSAQTGTRQSP